MSVIVVNLENIQRVIEDFYRLLFQQPAVLLRLGQVLARKIGGAHDYGAGETPLSSKEVRLDAIQLRIDASKVRQQDALVGMIALIVFQSQQALPPIEITVGQQAEAFRRAHEWREIREISRSVTQRVGGVQGCQQDQECRDSALVSNPLPHRRRKQNSEGIHGQDVALAEIETGKKRHDQVERGK